jgi:hypothetical protein
MRTVAVVFCLLSDLPAVLAAGLGQTSPSPTPPTPEPVKLPEPSPAAQPQQQLEPPKEEPAPAVTSTAPLPTEEPPKRRTRGSSEKPAATDPKTPAEALIPPPKPLGDPPPRQDPYGAAIEEKPLRQRSGPSVRLPSGGPSISFEDETIPENP